MKAAEQA